MKQFVLLFDDVAIEHTGYFKSEKECIQWVQKRYKDNGDGILIRSVYPVLENEYFSVKTGKLVNTLV